MRHGVWAALLVWLPVSICAAQEDGEGPTLYLEEWRKVDALSDASAGNAVALLGRVTIAADGLFRVHAPRMIVWLDPKAEADAFALVEGMGSDRARVPVWAVKAIYAEAGRVPAVFDAGGRIFRCSAFYYDFDTHRGLVLDSDFRLSRAGAGVPDLVLRAERFRFTGPGRVRAENARFFASEYHEPEVALTVEEILLEDDSLERVLGRLQRIRLRDREAGAGPRAGELEELRRDLDVRDPQGKRIRLRGLRARAFGVPFFRWDEATMEGDDLPPVRVEVEAGRKGSIGDGGRVGVGMRTPGFDWMVGSGYYDGRGPLADFESTLSLLDGRLGGRTFGVYLHDHGEDRGIFPNTRDRYWTKNQYRFHLSDTWRLDGELADLSDGAFLRAYDEREFKEGKEQETLLYLRRRGETTYFTATGKVRSIGFLDVLEELPRFTIALPAATLLRFGVQSNGEPLALQVAGHAEVGYLRRMRGDGDPAADRDALRFDAEPTLFLPFDLGPVRVTPFGTFRLTLYDESVDGSSAARYAGSAGVRADVQAARWYGGVRHVVNVSLEYVDLYTLTESAATLFRFDRVDAVSGYEMVGVRLRNRLQRQSAQGLIEFLSLELFGAWFPDSQRPLLARGDGVVELDLEWRPVRVIGVSARAGVETGRSGLETGSFGLWWQAREHLRFSTEIRHLRSDSRVLTASAELDVQTRWRLVGFAQVDLRGNDALDQGLLIQRLGETAAVGVRFTFDPGDEAFGASLRFELMRKFRRRRSRERQENYRRELGYP